MLDFFYDHRDDDPADIAHAVIHNEKMWGKDLHELPGFEEAVAAALKHIDEVGMYQAMKEVQG